MNESLVIYKVYIVYNSELTLRIVVFVNDQVLENRTKASLQEMDMLETLEELKEIRSKNSKVDLETLLRMNELASVEKARREEQSDEDYVK